MRYKQYSYYDTIGYQLIYDTVNVRKQQHLKYIELQKIDMKY